MEKSKLLFDLSEEDAAHVMSTISLIEKFDVTSVARIRNEIEESIQRGKEIREFLQRSSIENYEEHIQQVSLLSADIERLKIQLEYTPFARIDTEHRANITKLLFKELNGQLFVLSTNEELRHEHVQALDEQIAKVYMLEYGEDKRTSIIEGRYFEV